MLRVSLLQYKFSSNEIVIMLSTLETDNFQSEKDGQIGGERKPRINDSTYLNVEQVNKNTSPKYNER